MKEFVISEAKVETAVLVGLVTQTQNERKTAEYLDELAFLAETAGAEVVKRFTQKLDQPNSVTYVGKGKLDEIKAYIDSEAEQEREVGMVIFDDDRSSWTSSPCGHRRPTPRRRWSWRNINICCPACNDCGLTWNVREVVRAQAVEKVPWDCVDRARRSWRWTDASS